MWWLLEGSRMVVSAKRLGYWLQERDLATGYRKETWLLVAGKRLGRWLQERDLVDGFGKKILLLVSAWKTEAGSKVSGRNMS